MSTSSYLKYPICKVSPMNISGTLNVFRLIRDPALCLPQHTVSTFNHLPIPLSKAFPKKDGEKEVDIRAVVLDKDNCFAVPHANEVHKPYNVSQPAPRYFLSNAHPIPYAPKSMLTQSRKNSRSLDAPIPGPSSS